jgi:ADP-heptose:LPS heptosyltransferase
MTRSSALLAGLEPARVCIIKPSSLGDVVHALPILAALRARWPAAHLAWVVNRPFQDVLQGRPDLDELIVYDRDGLRLHTTGVGGIAELIRRLSSGWFDVTIDLQGLLRSALMAVATMARVRIGMTDAREGARWFYTHSIDAPRLSLHAVERVLRVARALGSVVADPRFDLPIRNDHREWARMMLAGVPRPRVVLHVGARWPPKRWPPRHFAEIARRAVREYGAGLIAVGASHDRPLVDTLTRHLMPFPILDLCGQTGLLHLAALTLESDLMISNDTGPLHLAAAAGARVTGVYTCTSPILTGPYGPHATTVQSHVWCASCYRKSCPRMDRMPELTPDRVWPVVKSQLEQVMARSGRLR